MLTFPLYFIALPFLLLYGIWVIFSLFSLYHVAMYGYINKFTYFVTVGFLGLSIISSFAVYDILRAVDWFYIINIQVY